MADLDRRQLNRHQIEEHLKSAVSGLTPDVLGHIDLSAAQDEAERVPVMISMRRRLRVFGTLAAACLCMVIMAGGVYTYQNSRVDSVIGIDVNPSIELSVNRRSEVLKAVPLNDDAIEILSDMELKGVDLNVAVNAVIGSMVKHGYLDDLDNAILVTVSNDSVSKAANLRAAVVDDIQSSLEENQVNAVVYDQQAVEMDEVKALASQYGISYGKAYFIQELIDQNPSLDVEDMESLASLSMEEIAKVITERSYALGERTDKREGNAATTAQVTTSGEETTSEPDTSPEITTVAESESTTGTEPSDQTTGQTTAGETTTVATTQAAETETTEEVVTEGNVKIDYVDYDNGVVSVTFKTKVRWKNPTVSVKDKEGNAYSALVDDTSSSSCTIRVDGLEGGKIYTFVLGGVAPKSGKATTARGTFETPVVGENATEAESETPEETETDSPETTTGSENSSPETGTGAETSAAETTQSAETSATEATSPSETEHTEAETTSGGEKSEAVIPPETGKSEVETKEISSLTNF